MMMKKILPLAIVAAIAISMTACKDEESNMAQMETMKDSIFKAYPSVASVNIKVEEHTNIHITLGSKKLAKDDEAARRQLANELGVMALRIFNKSDNNESTNNVINALDKSDELEKGTLTITPTESNIKIDPEDGVNTPINIDSLKKAMGKAK
jgi:hypothetical protein